VSGVLLTVFGWLAAMGLVVTSTDLLFTILAAMVLFAGRALIARSALLQRFSIPPVLAARRHPPGAPDGLRVCGSRSR
jgi:hypothetical protein